MAHRHDTRSFVVPAAEESVENLCLEGCFIQSNCGTQIIFLNFVLFPNKDNKCLSSFLQIPISSNFLCPISYKVVKVIFDQFDHARD